APAQTRELLTEFGDFGSYHVLAVRLTRIVGEEIKVHLLSRPEAHTRLFHASHNGRREGLMLAQLFDDRLRLTHLRITGRENRGAILRADVVTLTIERGRVMDHEKDFQQITITDTLWIEFNAHRLSVTGTAFTHRTVFGVIDFTTAISRRNDKHALDIPVDRVQAPKTSA